MRAGHLASALLLASPATAQAPGHAAPATTATVTQAELSERMGACLLGRDRRAATALVSAADEGAQRAASARVRPDLIACLAGRRSATLNGLSLRGAIAEQLLSENGGLLLGRAAALAPIAPVRVPTGAGAGEAALTCAVRAAPADAAALLRQPASTPTEAAAFRALAPMLQACAPAQGAVSIKPYAVRWTVALALFQAAQARGPQTGDTGAGTRMLDHA